jgi:hypothetical protein
MLGLGELIEAQKRTEIIATMDERLIAMLVIALPG